jgi:hypothetical protein
MFHVTVGLGLHPVRLVAGRLTGAGRCRNISGHKYDYDSVDFPHNNPRQELHKFIF